MSYQPQTNTSKPAPSFGGVQQTFAYKLRQFMINDQITIIEDLPRNKPIRQALRAVLNPKPGQKTQYTVFLIKITSNNFEADLELFEEELNKIAIARPKDIQNFKGTTLAFDGRRWQYICSDTTTPRDPRQPDLNPPQYAPPQPQDQADVFMQKLVNSIKTLDALGNKVDASVMTKIAESITPGKALDLIMAAKAKGYIVESQGIFKVIE